MSQEPLSSPAEFDESALICNAVLAMGIPISGEDKNYFTRRCVEWLRSCLNPVDLPPAAAIQVQ